MGTHRVWYTTTYILENILAPLVSGRVPILSVKDRSIKWFILGRSNDRLQAKLDLDIRKGKTVRIDDPSIDRDGWVYFDYQWFCFPRSEVHNLNTTELLIFRCRHECETRIGCFTMKSTLVVDGQLCSRAIHIIQIHTNANLRKCDLRICGI